MKSDMSRLHTLSLLAQFLIVVAWVGAPCSGQEGDVTSTQIPDLWTAARHGALEQIDRALATGAKINAQDANGITPLSWAAMSAHKDAVVALVKAGADVNSRNGDGATPLIVAAFFGRSEVVRALLELGARVDAVNDEGENSLAVMEITWNTTGYRARSLGIELDKYQVRQGRNDSTAILREHGAIEEKGGSPLAFAVLVVIAGIVGGAAWLRSRAEKAPSRRSGGITKAS